MLKQIYFYFKYIGFILIIFGCAQVVTPTGGIKDITPPQIKSSKPENYATNFDSKNVTIAFDEYIQLKDLNKSLIISPPLKEKPMIRVKGKSLTIRFESELKDSTTYNLYFGNALQDFNEGNPYKDFQYVFSTGDFVDSISFSGTVLNSFDLVPIEDAFVMLYSTLSDSIPYKEIPEYISKTDKNGNFKINNIRNDRFKVFALKDVNNNYRFDVNSEEIAYSDSLVIFTLENITYVDTIFKISEEQKYYNKQTTGDTPKKKAPIGVIDTIKTYTKLDYVANKFTLLMFTEDFEPQYLLNHKRDEMPKLEFIFKQPVKDSLIFKCLDNPEANFLKEISSKRDTFIYWLTDTIDYNKKDLRCIVSYQKLDSTEQYIWKTDTLKMVYLEIKQPKKSETEIKSNVALSIKSKSTQDLNKNIILDFTAPILSIDTSKIALYSIIDSTEIKIPITLEKSKMRVYKLLAEWQENTNYRLELLPDFSTDIYNISNDTIITEFRSQKLDFYGTLLIKISGIEDSKNIIVQLISSDKKTETVIAEKYINSDQQVDFKYLPPKEFLVKLVFDDNNNKIWDTGNYLKHIQPEEVLYYEKSVKTRSNWDVEISIDLNKRK